MKTIARCRRCSPQAVERRRRARGLSGAKRPCVKTTGKSQLTVDALVDGRWVVIIEQTERIPINGLDSRVDTRIARHPPSRRPREIEQRLRAARVELRATRPTRSRSPAPTLPCEPRIFVGVEAHAARRPAEESSHGS